jgi:hypothetical protein
MPDYGNYNLFLDDERFPPCSERDNRPWIIARTSDDGIDVVKQFGMPKFISFDHDLGGSDTGMVFLHRLICYSMDFETEFTREFYVHSQNPVGKRNIESLMHSFLEVKYGSS